MDESEKPSDFEIRGLSLIDVSFEDDCLINSSFSSPLRPPHSENQEQKTVRFLEPFEAIDISFTTPDEKKEESQPLESLESRKTKSGFKYNLRKSLAWDNAFFTSEGVLEPEELSSMIGGNEKSEKHVLPGIQEDVQKSSDSLSTLDGDSLTLKSLELDLFEDIRASIQKSSKAANAANSNGKKLGVSESQIMQSSKKVDAASQEKMKPRIASRKPSVGTQGSGKATKQVSVHPQASQSVVTNGGSTSSPGKPPKALGRISSISTISTKRASIGTNRIKLEKDNSKNPSGRGAPASKVPSGGSRNIAPRPTPPSRSALRSSAATKNELTTSCSSFGSSGSASSDSIGKISSNSMRRKVDSGSRNPSSSSSTVKSLSRTTPKGKTKSGTSHLTAYMGSVTKHSSSISPASSISEWSSESTASTSTAIQRRISTRVSQDSSSSKGVSVDNDAPRVLENHNSSTDQCPVGNDAKVPSLKGECVKRASRGTEALLCPTSIKPSGLRMPSPKIGFFDGVRSAGRTPNGSMQTHPGIPKALPKIGAGSVSPSGGSNKAKLGTLQPARTSLAIRSTKPDAHQNATTIKPRSPLALRESSVAAKRLSNVSKNVKSPLVSPRVQGRMSPKIGGDSVLKAEKVGSRGHDISASNSAFAEKNGSPRVLKHKVSPEHNRGAHASGSKFIPVNGLNASSNVSSTPDAENINPSQKVGEDAKFDKHSLNLKNDLGSLHNLNEKETAQFEDQVDVLTRQVRGMDMNLDVEKKIASPTLEKILTEN